MGGASDNTAGLKGLVCMDPERNGATLQRLYDQAINGTMSTPRTS
jgi:hypothetical protein